MTSANAWREGARVLLAWLYAVAGLAHLSWPAPFLLIMPEAIPFPEAVVLITGLLEIAGAIGLLLPRWRKAAGLMLAIYAVCVFPANIRHVSMGFEIAGWTLDWWYHGPRLALQPVLVWLALWTGGWGHSAARSNVH